MALNLTAPVGYHAPAHPGPPGPGDFDDNDVKNGDNFGDFGEGDAGKSKWDTSSDSELENIIKVWKNKMKIKIK